MKKKVAILGATGYTGVELLRILLKHKGVRISGITSERFAETKISEIFPSLADCDLVTKSIDDRKATEDAELVFSCLPAEKSAEIVPDLIKSGQKVIDLSAAFRFSDADLYEKYYHRHPAKELLSSSIYGIPELNKSRIKKARLVANPGCYPISVLLPLVPLTKELQVIPPIIIDSKSGVTGAGRNPTQELHFPEVNEGFRPYKPLTHRHQPEMESQLKEQTGKEVQIAFVPHLLPINRGILSTIYIRVEGSAVIEKIEGLLNEFYAGERFIKILPKNILPNPSYVKGTNYCYISVNYDKNINQIIIFSAIDNLGKGASTNAVQNMNIMLGFEESEGLDALPAFP